MKLLMLLAVVVAIVWLWRSARGPAAPKASRPTAPNPTAMVRCAVCAVHVPEAEVITGQRGSYCSEQHRRQAET